MIQQKESRVVVFIFGVLSNCRLCALCNMCVWVRWWSCECISILLQWAKSYSRLGLNSPKNCMCFCVLHGFIYVGQFNVLLLLFYVAINFP
jgi:hypothetical protein